MNHKIDCNWMDGMAFENTVDGHKIVVDADSEFGGKNRGPRPKLLLLNALAGCTGMDVVSMLGKMKQNLGFFNVTVEAESSDEHPKIYTKIHIIYQFSKADELDDKKVRKAIKLSEETYCAVSAMLRKSSELSWEIQYLD